MPYFTDLHTYLHQSSLLIQAYPSTRITTKYSLPRKPNTKARTQPKQTPAATTAESSGGAPTGGQLKRESSAVLTLKTYDAESGICLKYRTDKAAEVGRLLVGLGRIAQGEVIELPTVAVPAAAADGDKMDVDSEVTALKVEDKVVTAPPAVTQTGAGGANGGGGGGGGGGGKGKKKKGKK